MKARTWIGIIVVGFILFVSFFFFVVGLGLFILTDQDTFFNKGDVAVIKIEGRILNADPVIRQINKIAKNKNIKAVVVRINCPGGTIGGSQEIYSEIKKLKEKKPVVASMGTVGASGGYYVALGANKIFANPGTITGSIGVLFEYVNAQDLISWMKLKPETFKSGKLKDLASPMRAMTEEEKEFLQKTIDALHQQFKAAVAEERSFDLKELDKIADGRILTGKEALAYGLIDRLGTLADAIEEAAKLAGIEGEPTVIYPKKEKLGIIDLIMESAVDHLVVKLKSHLLAPTYLTN